MVIFRRPEGKAGYHQADGVEDAVRFVERLRNQENVTDAHIFRMEEVPIEVRTYYRVEVATGAPDAAPAAAAPAPAPPAPVPAPVPASVAAALPVEPSNGDAAELGPQDVLDPAPVEVTAARGRRFGRN